MIKKIFYNFEVKQVKQTGLVIRFDYYNSKAVVALATAII